MTHCANLSPRRWQFAVLPLFEGVELLRLEDEHLQLGLHARKRAQLLCVERGAARVALRHGSLLLRPGSVLLLAPSTIHEITSHGIGESVLCQAEISAQAVIDGAGAPPQRFMVPDGSTRVVDDRLLASRVIGAITDALHSRVPSPEIERVLGEVLHRTAVTRVAGGIVNRATACEPAIEALKAVLDRADSELVDLDAMAAMVGMNRFGVSRAFRDQVGAPPVRYALQARLVRGRTLLADGESVSGTALALGFADQSHFSRGFARLFAVSPAEYRRAWISVRAWMM